MVHSIIVYNLILLLSQVLAVNNKTMNNVAELVLLCWR